MKKVITLLLAFALILGMSQCKKKVETISSAPASVYITLDVEGGDKVIVNPHGHTNPDYATVTFEQGDVIYVGNNGAYCGELTYNSTDKRFEGEITPTSANDGDFLHFYFMGNKAPVGSAPSSVDISDQTAKYPVISYGRSTQLYNSVLTNYSATLYNKCAIMKFNVTGGNANDVVTITGMNNVVTVDFSKNNGSGSAVNPYTYSKSGRGDIALHTEANGERWAILLPQDEVTDATAYAPGYATASAFTVPAVSTNGYYASGVTVTLESTALFSVARNRQVRFAPGNLQAVFATANSSACTWRFAPTQYSYIGNAIANTKVGNNCVTTPGIVDLFCWVGANSSLAPYGINNEINETLYGNTKDEPLKSDWGVVANAANLGGHNDWRTPTYQEWAYLISGDFYTNDTRADKFAAATVNGTHGMVLLPDAWILPTGCTFTAGFGDGWNTNIYNATAWALMEAAGVVFLPAAGARWGSDNSVNHVYVWFGEEGYYWASSSSSTLETYAETLRFNATHRQWTGMVRTYGFPVRLVR